MTYAENTRPPGNIEIAAQTDIYTICMRRFSGKDGLRDVGSGVSGIMEALGKRLQVWHVGANNGGGLKGMQCSEIQRRRKQPAFACLVVHGAGGPIQVAAPGEDDEQLKVSRVGR